MSSEPEVTLDDLLAIQRGEIPNEDIEMVTYCAACCEPFERDVVVLTLDDGGHQVAEERFVPKNLPLRYLAAVVERNKRPDRYGSNYRRFFIDGRNVEIYQTGSAACSPRCAAAHYD